MCCLQSCCLSCVSQLTAGEVLATLPSSQGLLVSRVIQSPDSAGYSKHLYIFGVEFFSLSLLELCKSELSGL